MKSKKHRRPQDLTLRNLRALKKQIEKLKRRIKRLEKNDR